LEKKDISVASDLSSINARTVVIRSHGVPKDIEEKIRGKKVRVIDTTCPFVKRVQNLAYKLEQEGYKVLILGEESHPEVVGIKSYAPRAVIVNNINDIQQGIRRGKIGLKPEKIALISQTTKDLKLFQKISEFLREKFKDIKIINTICDATEKRQEAARQLAAEVDIMIVIGGKNSSNTTRLREICEKITKTYHIEKADELRREWFRLAESVGLTAGASTPDFSVKGVLREIEKYG